MLPSSEIGLLIGSLVLIRIGGIFHLFTFQGRSAHPSFDQRDHPAAPAVVDDLPRSATPVVSYTRSDADTYTCSKTSNFQLSYTRQPHFNNLPFSYRRPAGKHAFWTRGALCGA